MKSITERIASQAAAATEAAVEKAKGTPFVDETGEIVEPPTTAELMMWFKGYQQQATDFLDQLQNTVAQQAATITSQASTIVEMAESVKGKASANTLADLRQRLSTLGSAVEGKADTTYVEQQFAANYELDATQSNAIKAAQELLASDGGLLTSLMSAQTVMSNQLGALRGDVDLKAPAATVSALTGQVTTLRNTVTDASTGLATKASTTDLGAQKTRIDGLLTTTLPALQTDVSSRLLRSGDTATGPIVVPTATNKIAAPRFEQVFGGINSPRRTMENITTGTTELQPLTDTTGQNRKILPIGVLFLLMGNQPSGSVTVKLGTTPGGAELYTKTYSLLSGLLGKVLAPDLPASATPLPAGQRLFATVTGGGQWTCFFDAVFLPTAS
jgi:hypothetical protein